MAEEVTSHNWYNYSMVANSVSPSLSFVHGLQKYLQYWLKKTTDLDDNAIGELNVDFPNLLRMIKMGLVLTETQQETAVLIWQCFFWIEQAGYSAVWQPLVKSALQNVREKDTLLTIRLLKQLGQLQRLQRQLDESIISFVQVEKMAKQLADYQLLAEAQMNLCQVYHLKRNYKRAAHFGNLALKGFTEDNAQLKAITFRTLGIMAQERGNYQLSEDHLHKTISLSSKKADKVLTMNALAVTLHKQGKHQAALHIYQELEAILDRNINTNMLIEVQLNRGSLLYELGQLDEAQSVFYEAEQLLQNRPGLFFYKALAANNLGCILRDQAEYVAAESYFGHSINLYMQIGADVFQANAWGNLAKLFAKQNRRDDAMASCNEALALAENHDDSIFAQELITNYTILYSELEAML